ncbi:MAG: N-acetylmuramoyl-L-alanine amidase [Candidatus Rokubacteria bacterium]|nr:N-acetylmuramoyl-L-alanine amidase [Candidatus Rokubacteria bacterium]
MWIARVLTVLVVVLWTATASAELPRVTHEGRKYVELFRVAEHLRAEMDATSRSVRAHIRTGGHVVTVTRNWAQVLIDGTPVVLDAPVRVRRGIWLVPEAFVTRVVPRVTATAATASPPLAAPPRPSATPARVSTAAVTLDELRVRSYPSFTRVVFETSGPVRYTVESRGPREARVRLTALAAEPRGEEVRDGFVGALALERAAADAVLRVTFEGAAGELQPSQLADPPRLVLDFLRPAEPEPRERRDVATPLKVMVLDAGHGGHDPGAIGPTGLTEKELVLDVTLRARRLVEERLGIKVRLSRDSDSFVTLRDRTSFANRERADVFVSIHANAHRQAASEGVEIYFLSSEATDSGARQTAALENAVVQLEKPAAGRARSTDVLKSILWDLAQSAFQAESSNLAETVLDAMTRSLRIPNRGVKQAGFYVLGGAAMPAILVEIGFVTNPREERRLRDSRYRDEIARAIVDGLAEYKRRWDQRMRTALQRPR